MRSWKPKCLVEYSVAFFPVASILDIVSERPEACCCMALSVSTDTLRVSEEWMACLADSCKRVK